MAWNEPGGPNRDRDPWNNNRDQGPPDLDEVIKRLTAQFSRLFGKGGGGGRGDDGTPMNINLFALLIPVGIVAVLWLISGIYTVEAGKRGIVTRFGHYTQTTMPGLNYHLPFPIERVEMVDVEQRRAIEIGYRTGGQGVTRSVPREALMLTQDENIVDIRVSVQYQVSDPVKFLFRIRDPEETLRQVTESATREKIGKLSMDFVLTEGRSQIVQDIRALSQDLLDSYSSGIIVTNVNLQDAQPPEEVQDAFADAIKAREDEQRLINEAEAYVNEILPRARGEAARLLQEAQAYRDQVIARAEGEASRFTQILMQYNLAPAILRDRLYLETMETVLSNTSKVLLDIEGSNNILYLPIDGLNRGNSSLPRSVDRTPPPPPTASMPFAGSNPDRSRNVNRSREMP